MTSNMIRAIIKAKRASAPMTIPAIAPFDNPPLFPAGTLVAEGPVPVGITELDVDVGKLVENVIEAVIVGRTTLAHLCSAPAL